MHPVSQTRWDPLSTERIGRWEKYPEISSQLENYTELSSPLRKAIKYWEFPLDFWAVNNRIRNPHPLKAIDFESHWHLALLFLIPTGWRNPTGSVRRGCRNCFQQFCLENSRYCSKQFPWKMQELNCIRWYSFENTRKCFKKSSFYIYSNMHMTWTLVEKI